MAQALQQEADSQFAYEKGLKKTVPGLMSRLKYVDLWLNRPVAGLLVRLVYNSSITPNNLTLISLFFGLGAAIVFGLGMDWSFIVGALLLQTSSVIDGADGMLARSKGMGSRYGAFLDLFCDRFIDFFNICGLSIGAFHAGFQSTVMLLGLLAAGLYCLQISQFYLLRSYLQTPGSGDTGEARAVAVWVIVICSFIGCVNLLLYAILLTTLLMNLGTAIRFVRARHHDSGGGA